MKKVSISLLMLFLVGCDQSRYYIHPELVKYNQMFLDEAKKRKIHFPFGIGINFTKNVNNLGACQIFETQGIFTKTRTRYIWIHPDTWAYMTEEEKEMMLFHEQGHCYLRRGHTNARSLMQPYPISDYYSDREYYVEELFRN